MRTDSSSLLTSLSSIPVSSSYPSSSTSPPVLEQQREVAHDVTALRPRDVASHLERRIQEDEPPLLPRGQHRPVPPGSLSEALKVPPGLLSKQAQQMPVQLKDQIHDKRQWEGQRGSLYRPAVP